MGLGMGCLYMCAPFTLIASILLFMLAVMLRDGNWTFQVLASKNDWDLKAKSNACRNGGVIYICISAVLWVLVLMDSFVLYLEKVPGFVATLWRQKRLPSWRELRRSHRKTTISNARANPAVDVVVSALSAAPAVSQPTPSEEPLLDGQADSPRARGAAAATGTASSPLTGEPHTGPRGVSAAPAR